MPEEEAKRIKDVSTSATYGWGMIPVDASIGETEWYTALFPKESLYVVPIKAAIRKAERLEEGQLVRVRLSLKFREFDPFESKFS